MRLKAGLQIRLAISLEKQQHDANYTKQCNFFQKLPFLVERDVTATNSIDRNIYMAGFILE